MSGTSYLSLSSPSRVSNYLGLKMSEGAVYTYPPTANSQYGYIQIPVGSVTNISTEEVVQGKASRNQAIYVAPACTVDVRGSYRFEVHPNPALWSYGTVQGMYYLEPGEHELVPGFYLQLRKDLDLSEIEYAVRIYMRA